jgi:hypothetical protein
VRRRGVLQPVGSLEALRVAHGRPTVEGARAHYAERRDAFLDGLGDGRAPRERVVARAVAAFDADEARRAEALRLLADAGQNTPPPPANPD